LGYFDSPDFDLPAGQQRHIEELFRQFSPAGYDTIVDVGCGQGNTARWLRRHYGANVIGIDILGPVLEKSRTVDDLPLAQCDMAKLALRSDRVDMIVAVESLYALPNRQVAFAEFARVLRHGGVMLLSEFMLGTEPNRLSTRVVSAVVGSNSLAPEAVYQEQLRLAGFVDISMVDVGEATAVGTAAFLKARPALRHRVFRARLGEPRGRFFSSVGFPLLYKTWCDAFTSKRVRHVFVTARRRR
jgi:SAM-dependent methyltransferase